MHYGLMTFVTDRSAPIRDVARAAEDAGFDSLWVTEKTHVPMSRETPWPGGDLPEHYLRTYDPFVALTAAASVTERIRVGTGVCLAAVHDPVILAKTVASLDHLSGGRFNFGVGYGWNREELATHGLALGDAPAALADSLALMRALWTEPERGHRGPFHQVEPSWCWPRPTQARVPVLYGGIGSDRVFADVVAHADGWMPIDGFGWVPDDVGRLRKMAADAGRDPESIRVVAYSVGSDADRVAELAEAGVDAIVFWLPPAGWDDVSSAIEAARTIVTDRGDRS